MRSAVFIKFLPAKAAQCRSRCESFDYEYKIPEHHPDGTYWFHPHRHGSVVFQFMGGMAGALLIEGPTDYTLRDYCGKI